MIRLLFICTVVASCAACGTHIPKNTPCQVASPTNDLICSDGSTTWHKTILEADKYICWSPEDVKSIFTYIRQLERDNATCKK